MEKSNTTSINFARDKINRISSSNLYLGDIDAANDFENLKKLGITHILTVSIEDVPNNIEVFAFITNQMNRGFNGNKSKLKMLSLKIFCLT
jgi:hypothetical protein